MRNINDLRERLFDVMDGLKDKSIDTETAKGICQVGQVIVNTLDAEVKMYETVGGIPSGFILPNATNKTTNRIK
jgi:hypothetical protein